MILLDYQKAVTRDANGPEGIKASDPLLVIYAECRPWHASLPQRS
jgi:hypothetical protein